MPGLRLLHTADVHLGAPFNFLGRRGREQREQLKATFARVVDLALTSQADLLIIAGDLFHAPSPGSGLLGEVAYQLGRLDAEGIWTVIAPGTHDPPLDGGAYDDGPLSSLPHVYVFRGERMEPLVIEGLDLAVYGMASQREGDDALAGFRAREGPRWRVGVVHASMRIPGRVEEDAMMVTGESVAASGLHYLALGHWHSLADHSRGEVTAYYPGPPEALGMGDGERGRVLLVELEEGEKPLVKPIVVGRRRFLRMDVDAGEAGGPRGLYARIREMADNELALRVNVLRTWGEEWMGFPWDKLEEELAPLFFHLQLRVSPVSLGLQEVEEFPETTVSGRFLRLAREEMARREGEELLVAEEALHLGLAHLSGEEPGT